MEQREYEERISQLERQVAQLSEELEILTASLAGQLTSPTEPPQDESLIEPLNVEPSLEAYLEEFGPKRVTPRRVRTPKK